MPFSTARLIVIVAIITAILGIILFLDQYSIVPLTQLPGLSAIVPKPTSKVIKNVLYPTNPDPSGRNILFYSNEKDVKYSGVGIKYHPKDDQYDDGITKKTIENPQNTPYYAVGIVEKWENIEGSLDKYLYLGNAKLTLEEKSIIIPKIRVGFGTSKEFIDNKKKFATAMGVIDLNEVIPEAKTHNPQVNKMGLIADYSQIDLDKLIMPGDAIVLVFQFDYDTGSTFVDENNKLVASWIILRRFVPLQSFTMELGRSFQFK